MTKSKFRPDNLFKALGALGTLTCLAIFIHQPSFPTPDKLIVLMLFIFMIFGQALAMLRRLGLFVVFILGYELFRGLAHSLNHHINYTLAPHFDRLIFGKLPTTYLQDWLWRGHVRWYDYVFYVPYMLFFVLPLALGILVWKTRAERYWEFFTAYSLTFFGGWLTYSLFPAAPPWMASQQGFIEPIQRISSDVWASLGIKDFPSLYNHVITANPVAAVPSLHAASSTLFSILIFKLYGRGWGALSLIYPGLICFGVIYQGEHYFFDVVLGIIYAIAAYKLTPSTMRLAARFYNSLRSHWQHAFRSKTPA